MSNLVVRRGKPEEVVANLIKQLGSVSTVTFHEEVASEELNVEKRVKDVCAQMNVKVHTCWGSTLYHRDDLPFHHISRLPDVYTQFRKAAETQTRVRPLFPTPKAKASPPRAGGWSHPYSRGPATDRASD